MHKQFDFVVMSRPASSAARLLLALTAGATLTLSGCASQERRDQSTARQINQEMNQAISSQPRATPQTSVSAALLPPLAVQPPRVKKAPEERFNLTVNNASAQQVFLGIVSGTRYSMLVSPEITGALSINLKNVTVFEALDSIRELYGYDYRVEGNRIFVEPLTARTRVFKINYINGQRKGTSDIRVTSGSVSDAPNTGTSSTGGPTTTTNSTTPSAFETSKITTTTESDFWSELRRSLTAIIGAAGLSLTTLFTGNPLAAIACLSIASIGISSAFSILWSVPGIFLSKTAAAGGIALITTIGGCAGVVAPIMFGKIKELTGGFNVSLFALSGALVLSALLMLLVFPKKTFALH